MKKWKLKENKIAKKKSEKSKTFFFFFEKKMFIFLNSHGIRFIPCTLTCFSKNLSIFGETRLVVFEKNTWHKALKKIKNDFRNKFKIKKNICNMFVNFKFM